MDLITAQLVVSGIVALLNAVPGIIEAIDKMDAPDEEKGVLVGRIRMAQSKLPKWE